MHCIWASFSLSIRRICPFYWLSLSLLLYFKPIWFPTPDFWGWIFNFFRKFFLLHIWRSFLYFAYGLSIFIWLIIYWAFFWLERDFWMPKEIWRRIYNPISLLPLFPFASIFLIIWVWVCNIHGNILDWIWLMFVSFVLGLLIFGILCSLQISFGFFWQIMTVIFAWRLTLLSKAGLMNVLWVIIEDAWIRIRISFRIAWLYNLKSLSCNSEILKLEMRNTESKIHS